MRERGPLQDGAAMKTRGAPDDGDDVAFLEDVPRFQVAPDAAHVERGPLRRVGHEAPSNTNNHGLLHAP